MITLQGFLTISQLSKIRKITSETLRYYDRIGLFKPEYTDPDTLYRYYSYAQCADLGTIIALKKLGMPLDDIKTFLNQKSIDSSITMLSNMKETINQKIRELSNVEKMLAQSLKKMQDGMNNIEYNKPFIQHINKRKIVSSEEYIEKLEEAIYYEMLLESRINGFYPIISTVGVGSVINPESFFNREKRKLRRTPMIVCEDEKKYNHIPDRTYKISYIAEGEYLCMYGKGRFCFSSQTADFLRKYVQENKYEPVGDILELDEIGLCITNSIEEVVYRIEIPIKSQKRY